MQYTRIINATDDELEESLRDRKALNELRGNKKQLETKKSYSRKKSPGSRGEDKNDDRRGANDEPVPDPTPLPPPREPMAPPKDPFAAKKSLGAPRATLGLPMQPFQPFQPQALPRPMPRAPPLTHQKDGNRDTHTV